MRRDAFPRHQVFKGRQKVFPPALVRSTTHGLCHVTLKAAAGPLKQKIGSP